MAFTISTGSLQSYSEGSFVNFVWRMERPDGQFLRNTTVPYTIVGLTASDVVGGKLSGTVAIDQFGSGRLTIQLANDLTTEGRETFYVSSNANFTPFTSNSVSVNDTSVAVRPSPPPSPPPAPAPTPTPAPVPVPPPAPTEQFHAGTRQADTITGSSLKDTMRVSSGADRFDGGAGTDTFDLSGLYSVLKEGERLLIGRQLTATYSDIIVRADMTKSTRQVDLATTFTRYDLFEKTTFDINTNLVNVENLTGTEFSDSFKGNSAANLLRTGLGRDTLMGMDGDDTLDAGDGADLIDGGSGIDTAVFKGSPSTYQFVRSGSNVQAIRSVNGRDEIDTLISIERVQFDSSTVNIEDLLPIIRTHQVTALTNSVNEGSLARFELATSGYAAGARVGYSISGITGADVINVPLWNTVAVDAAGKAIIEFNITADSATEGAETLIVTVEGRSASMTVNDTSVRAGAVGGESNDNLFGTANGDLIDGRGGNDRIDGGAGNDTLMGGSGNDYLIGGDGNDNLDGQSGGDFLQGGTGNDTYTVDSTGDTISEIVGTQGGIDLVLSSIGWTLGLDVENLTLSGSANIDGAGNTLNNRIVGNAGNNSISGLDGNDTLLGEAGNDRLTGGFGADSLTGGAGNDVFVYARTTDSANSTSLRDVIADFVRGQDKIDLSAIDARTSTSFNDAFTFLSSAPVSSLQANGALWFTGGILYGSVDSSIAPEFSIQLTGMNALSASDFIL
jgi:Ca2+-binding RTX toxin-like protein